MITPQQLKALYPRAKDPVLKSFAQSAPTVFGKFELDAKPERAEYLLAQIGHESGGLTIFEEGLNYSAKRLTQVWPRRFPTLEAAQPFANNPQKLANQVYSGRMGNRDPASGDGYAYRGRGFIQITGRDGYRNVGKHCGLELEKDPDLASSVNNQLAIACGFWAWKSLNSLCDARDFKAVTKKINGGLVGLEDRLAWLAKVRRVMAANQVPDKQPTAEVVRSVQLALRTHGITTVGAADGDLGPNTVGAIHAFRRTHDLGEGLIDDALLRALDLD